MTNTRTSSRLCRRRYKKAKMEELGGKRKKIKEKEEPEKETEEGRTRSKKKKKKSRKRKRRTKEKNEPKLEIDAKTTDARKRGIVTPNTYVSL